MKKIILGLVLFLSMQACSEKLEMNKVANTKWILSEWPSKTLPTSAQATLSFDAEGKIGGKSFCNSYGGNTVIADGTIKFEQIFSTKMFCTEFAQAENDYQADLQTINTAKVSDTQLQLLKDGVVIMVFKKDSQ